MASLSRNWPWGAVMRTIWLLGLLGLSGTASAQQWVELEADRLVDVSTIRTTPAYVESWWIGNADDWKPGDKLRSYRFQLRFKCEQRQMAVAGYIGYSQKRGLGSSVGSNFEEYPRYEPVAPGTTGAGWLEYVCAYVAKERWALVVAEAGSLSKAMELAHRGSQEKADEAIAAADAAAASAEAALAAMEAADLDAAEKAAGIGHRATIDGGEAGISVSTVTLGTGLDSSKRVTAPRVVFRPNDTIYASVQTSSEKPGRTVVATLSATWWYEPTNQLVNTDRSTFAFEDDGNTAFRIHKPDGWPLGAYRVDIALDDKIVQTIRFQVKP